MQSSRRKRDRGGSEQKGASAPLTSSRTRSARGAAQAAQADQVIGSNEAGTNNSAATSKKVPSADESSATASAANSGTDSKRQQSSAVTESSQVAVEAEESEGGNDHSEERTASPPSEADEEKQQIDPERTSQSGKQHSPSSHATKGKEETQDMDVNNGEEDSREKQIQAVLTHKRLLLDRIRQCRTAAESRLDEVAREKNRAKKAGGVKSEGEGGSSDADKIPDGSGSLLERNAVAETDEEEVAAFRELSRQAVNAAKKQRVESTEGPPQEKRVSVSLRRGSSVGKRMNAALSTLAPGGSSSGVGEPQTVPLSQTNAAATKLAASSGQGAVPGSGHPASAFASTSVKSSAHNQASLSTSKKASLYAQQPLLPATATASGKVERAVRSETGTQKIKRAGSQKNMKALSGAVTRGTSSEPYASSSLPLHFGTSESALPPNRLARSSVVYPEANALRQQRNSIRSKLAAMLYERQKRIENEEQIKSLPSVGTPQPAKDTQKAAPSWSSIMIQQRGPEQPTKMPRRRKTHWDYLLEEMRWLATDYIEERKWKASCGRILSAAVLSDGKSAVSPKAAVRGRGQKAGTLSGDAEDGKTEIDDDVNMQKADEEDEGSSSEAATAEEEPRVYDPPTSADAKAVRATARIISDMIAELWDVTVENGALSKSDDPHRAAHGRHMKLRKKLWNTDEQDQAKAGEVKPGKEADIKSRLTPTQTSEVQKPKVRQPGGKAECGELMGPGELAEKLPYDRITERVESSIETVKNRTKQESSEGDEHSEQLGGTEMVLTTSQHNAIDFVESVWGDSALPGVVLDGSAGCGMTITVCSLLWRQREEGPQLLICPPASVIRWKHELRRFKGVRVLMFGLQGGISSPDSTKSSVSSFGPCDIVICEYSSLRVEEKLDLSFFHTTTLDCRYTLASTGIVKPSARNSLSSSQDARQELPGIPPELLSSAWWNSFLNSLSSRDGRRLLVQYHGFKMDDQGNSISYEGLEGRQCLDYLAAKAAFILGPTLFYSTDVSITKKVLLWAKRRVKAETQKSRLANNRLEEMNSLLLAILHRHSHALGQPLLSGNRLDGSPMQWHVRHCTLPPPQRSEYDRCCSDVRGALSFGNLSKHKFRYSVVDPCMIAGNALMRLRRVCVHPHMQNMLIKGMQCSGMGAAPPEQGIYNMGGTSEAKRNGRGVAISRGSGFHGRTTRSASQPDVELALEILHSSAKLRELVTILRFECGYRFDVEETILAAIDKGKNSVMPKSSAGKSRRKKVVVLAALPEVQLLTSILLDAIGIAHDLLMKGLSSDNRMSSSTSSNTLVTSLDDPADGTFETRRNREAALAWIECQLALSRFDSGRSIESKKDASAATALNKGSQRSPITDLIIASPVTIGSGNRGLGAASAELVILLDEDWSGRGESLMNSIISKQLKPRGECLKNAKTICKFIRLVCADTCEEKFLAATEELSGQGRHPLPRGKQPVERNLRWPRDILGYLVVPLPYSIKENTEMHGNRMSRSKGRSLENGTFSFPCANIMKFRNADLSTVLCTEKPLPPEFATGVRMRFLPSLESRDQEDGAAEAAHPDGSTKDEHAMKGLDDAAVSISLIRALVHTEARSCPLSYQIPSDDTGTSDALSLSRQVTVVPPLPAEFPAMVTTRRDVMALSSRLYMELFGKSLAWDSVGAASTLAVQPEAVFLSGPSEDNAELADAWHKSGLSCKPGEFASSLLVYSSPASVVEDTASLDRDSLHLGDHESKQKNGSASSDCEGNRQQPSHVVEESVIPSTASSDRSSVGIDHVEKLWPRLNSYSESYSTARNGRSTVIRDGNQGCEPLVFFPPLFPDMILCLDRARHDIADIEILQGEKANIGNGCGNNQMVADAPRVEEASSRKRKEPPPSVLTMSAGKRPRIQKLPVDSTSTAHSNTVVTAPPASTQPERGTSYPAAAAGKASTAIHGSAGLAEIEPKIITEDEASLSDAASILLELNEDYGLAGIGALSLPSAAAKVASLVSTDTATYSHWNDPFEPDAADHDFFSSMLACDSEEADAATRRGSGSMDSMILFVGQRALSGLSQASSAQYFPGTHNIAVGAASSSAPWSATNQPRPGVSLVEHLPLGVGIGHGLPSSELRMNGAGTTKKTKKKDQIQSSSALAHLPGGVSMNHFSAATSSQNSKTKDGYRKRVLSLIGRQGAYGLSLFDYSSFRLASVRVRNRVAHRVRQASLLSSVSSGSGPGVPLLMTKRELEALSQQRHTGIVAGSESQPRGWASIVKKISSPGGKTGDLARSLSTSQRTALRRSLVSPSRVDFGPFQAGYLSSTSGMTGISPPRSRVGVSLPMGVKIPQQREQQQPPWTMPEEKKLQDCAVRFGLNWHLASRAVSGLEEIRVSSQDALHPRSARQCRERWQSLARVQGSLASEVRRSERTLRENAVLRPNQVARSLRDSALRKGLDTATVNVVVSSGDAVGEFDPSGSGGVGSLLLPLALLSGDRKSTSDQEPPAQRQEEEGADTKSPPDVVMSDVEAPPKRCFDLFKSAGLKKQNIEVTIPGFNGAAGSKPSLVESHNSHGQSVQAAVASTSSGGRADMWPLQLLDIADKKRGVSRQATSQGSAVSSSSSLSGNRQQSSQRPTGSSPSRSHQQRPAPYQQHMQTAQPIASPSRSPHRRPSVMESSFVPPPNPQFVHQQNMPQPQSPAPGGVDKRATSLPAPVGKSQAK